MSPGRDYLVMWIRHVPSRAVAAALAIVVTGRPLEARGQTPALIDYAASEGCPPSEQFAAEVMARGRSVVVVTPGSPAAMRVSVVPEPGGGFRGRLYVASDNGAREVRGPTCRDVVEALAVVAVSSLGRTESMERSPPVSEQPVEGPMPSEKQAQTPQPPLTTAAASPRAGHVGAVPEEVFVPAGTLTFERDNVMSVFGGVMTGIIPSAVIPRFDFEVARTNLVTSPDGNRYRVLPTVRLHGSFFPYGGKYHSSYGTTEATGFGGGADLCAPLHYDQTGLEVLLCAELVLGYFALDTTSPQGVRGPVRTAGFGTAGLGLDLVYNIGRHFNLGLKAGAALVLGPVTAQASDGSQIFQSSLVSVHAMIGAGGHF